MRTLINGYIEMMTRNDKRFFKTLGQRVSELRKEQHLTQVQLAEHINFSQQQVASFEAGRRKIPASLLPTLAELFVVPIEDLLGIAEQKSKRGPAPKLQRQIEQISRLPKTKQRFVMEMLDTVLQQAS
jgi:transcriptional regulator with XRE-family HTH domain